MGNAAANNSPTPLAFTTLRSIGRVSGRTMATIQQMGYAPLPFAFIMYPYPFPGENYVQDKRPQTPRPKRQVKTGK